MKFSAVALCFAPAVLAAPGNVAGANPMTARQSINTITDQLLFSFSLPTFETRRNALNPPSLDWSSDGCTTSPDNPFGFPFLPACHRHDFGYQNFRHQSRFTESGKLKIDNNFLSDLDNQCEMVSARGPCRALAEVYYAAVRAFGGSDATPGKRADSNLVQIYEEKMEAYKQAVAEAQEKGELPRLAE